MNHFPLVCPITLQTIKVPAVASDGCVYEAESISRWLENHSISPITGLELTNKILYPLYPHFDDIAMPIPLEKKTMVESISDERKTRIIELEKSSKNLKGIQKYLEEYEPENENKLNFAKEFSVKNPVTTKAIQIYVIQIIESNHQIRNTEYTKNIRHKLDTLLKSKNIVQIGPESLTNFSCLPLQEININGRGGHYDFQYADLRNSTFCGDGSTGGCLHGNFKGADLSNSIALNDFCTKGSIYTCALMSQAILTGYNDSSIHCDGAITIGTKRKINGKHEPFSECHDNPTIDSNEYLVQLENLKNKLKQCVKAT